MHPGISAGIAIDVESLNFGQLVTWARPPPPFWWGRDLLLGGENSKQLQFLHVDNPNPNPFSSSTRVSSSPPSRTLPPAALEIASNPVSMSGRGRGRPPSRSAQESAAGPSRRSTRQQQQQQNAAEPQHDDQEPHPESPPPQEEQQQEQQQQQFQEQQQQQQQQLDQLQPQLEAAMPAPNYHQIIDPAITGPQDAGMPPPPVPSAKNLRGQTISHAARRGTRRDMRASSMASTVNSIAPTDAYSSQPEPHSKCNPPAAYSSLSFASPVLRYYCRRRVPEVASSRVQHTCAGWLRSLVSGR